MKEAKPRRFSVRVKRRKNSYDCLDGYGLLGETPQAWPWPWPCNNSPQSFLSVVIRSGMGNVILVSEIFDKAWQQKETVFRTVIAKYTRLNTMLLKTVANKLPSGSNLDPLRFFFWLGSNTVAKTPLKKKKKGMGRCKQNQKDNAHRNKILV